MFVSTNLEETYQRMITKILESFAKYLKNGSGWRLRRVIRLDITLSKLNPVRGSSYLPLPKSLKTRSLINMKNNDQQCFKWAVTRSLHPVEYNGERITKILRVQSEKYNWDGIEFPTPCSERLFKKFEKNNNVSMLVFGHEVLEGKTHIIPLYVPTERYEKTARLFFYRNENEEGHHKNEWFDLETD